MKSRIQMVLVVGLSLLGFAACNAKEAHAPRDPLSVPDGQRLRTFPREDITFEDVQILMWREDTTEENVARVLENAAHHEDLQDELFLKITQKRGMTGLKALMEETAISDTVEPLDEQLKSHAENQAKLVEDRASLETLRAQPASEEKDKAIKKLEKSIARLESKGRPYHDFLIKVSQAGLNADLDSWRAIEIDSPQLAAESAQFVAAIERDAWRNASKSIHFSFSFHPDRRVHAKIENWDLMQSVDPLLNEDGVTSEFSTDARSIDKVTFEPRGGVFTFEVYTPAAVYWFKISGNKYDARDGRIHYKGDIVRCSVSDGYGRPVIEHVRDFVQCGVDTEGLILDPSDPELKTGVPSLRRGVANLADKKIAG